MGAGNFDIEDYKKQAETAKVSKNSGFERTSMCDEFNPAKVNMRFSRKGPFNDFREVITVLIGLDVTGSMDVIPKSLLTGNLGSLMVDLKKTYNRPNENLQLSFAGIGDAKSDEAPLQVTHFESDNRFALQLPKIWLEGHGGANGAESYNLLWWYAANKTHLNYVEQDARKGILITIGDDNVHPTLTASEIQMWLDPDYDGRDISNQVLLNAVRAQYEVYHIIVTDGTSYNYDYLKRANKDKKQKTAETKRWKDLLGPNNVMQAKSGDVARKIAEIVKRHRPHQKASMSRLTDKEWKIQNIKNLSDKQWAEVLRYTLCPLSRKIMEHPVVWGGSKRAYEKQAVQLYVGQNRMDPRTHEKITKNLILKPNLNIAQLCAYYKPFFDNLSDERKEKLVQLTLPPPKPVEQKDTGKDKSLVAADQAFFPSKNPESQQAKDALDKVENNLEGPLTHVLMVDPVLLGVTGHTFERKAIEEWLKKSHTDPLTGKKVNNTTLIPNYTVKRLCDVARENTTDSCTSSSPST